MSGITWKPCVTCGVSYPSPSLTKKGECFFCDPPVKIDVVSE